MFGFIIIRHVNSTKTNLLWQECYTCIRKFYNDKIVIIDDKSNLEFLTTMEMVNTEIVESEFPKRAELLPYYYLLKYAWFDTAVILHDSVFIQSPIKFDKYNKFLWHFSSHDWDNHDGEVNMIKKLSNHKELLDFYMKKDQWHGCFGVMSVVNYSTIHDINSKYNFFNLINFITSRSKRMILERIFASILWYETGITKENCSYFGNIQAYCNWGFNEGYTMENYVRDKQAGKISLPIVKLWSGR